MSHMILCDGCKKTMFADSRSEKGAYHDLWIDGYYHYHLCRICYDSMMRNILRMRWSEDEQQYVEEEHEDQ